MNPSAKAMPACYSPTPITSSGAIAEAASVKLKVADLHKSYGELQVLKGVSLNARNGDVISMVGASGSGKSTMLRCINFLEKPDAGCITLDGQSIEMRQGRGATRLRIPRSCRTCERAWPWSSSTSTCGAT